MVGGLMLSASLHPACLVTAEVKQQNANTNVTVE